MAHDTALFGSSTIEFPHHPVQLSISSTATPASLSAPLAARIVSDSHDALLVLFAVRNRQLGRVVRLGVAGFSIGPTRSPPVPFMAQPGTERERVNSADLLRVT